MHARQFLRWSVRWPASRRPAVEKPDITYKVFQFPANMIPRIDGNTDDWNMVPERLRHRHGPARRRLQQAPQARPQESRRASARRLGQGAQPPLFPLRGLRQLLGFLAAGLHNDIFELVVDGDASGGPLDRQGTHGILDTGGVGETAAAPDNRISASTRRTGPSTACTRRTTTSSRRRRTRTGAWRGVRRRGSRNFRRPTPPRPSTSNPASPASWCSSSGSRRSITPVPRVRSAPWNPC